MIAFSQPRKCYKQNSIHLDSRGRKKYESNGYQKGWTNKTWDVIPDRCFSHLSRHSVRSQVSYSQDDLEKSTLSLASVFVLSACMCTSVACVRVWALEEWPLFFAAVCPGCGTCVGCVMGLEEQRSVSVELNRPSHELRHHKWPLVHTGTHTYLSMHLFLIGADGIF